MKILKNEEPMKYTYMSSFDETLEMRKLETEINVQKIYDDIRKKVREDYKLIYEDDLIDLYTKIKYSNKVFKEIDNLTIILVKESNKVIHQKINNSEYLSNEKKKLIKQILGYTDIKFIKPLDYESAYIYDEIKNNLLWYYYDKHKILNINLVVDNINNLAEYIVNLVIEIRFITELFSSIQYGKLINFNIENINLESIK